MVFEKIKAIISEEFEIDEEEITMDSTMDDLQIDSIDAVDLTMAIEDEFDISIPDEELEGFKNVGDVVRYVESCVEDV